MMAYTKAYGGRDEDEDYYHEREGRIRDTIVSMAYGGEASYYPHGHAPPAPVVHSQPYRERSPVSHHIRSGGWHVEDSVAGYGSNRGMYGSSTPSSQQPVSGYSRPTYAPDDIRYALGGSNSVGGGASTMSGYGGASLGAHTYTDMGSERKVVRIEGLPYDVLVQEILEFFRGYHVNYENVRIQCRDDGSPSGKAFVTFPSEKLARHAITDLNRHYIRGRFVELFIL